MCGAFASWREWMAGPMRPSQTGLCVTSSLLVPLPNLQESQVWQVTWSLLTLMTSRALSLKVLGIWGWGGSSLLLPVHGFLHRLMIARHISSYKQREVRVRTLMVEHVLKFKNDNLRGIEGKTVLTSSICQVIQRVKQINKGLFL